MKGEMKMTKSLCLKGLTSPNGRDGAFFDNNCSFINNARLIFNHAALFAPDVPLLGTIYSHCGNKRLPAWEQNIPCVGISNKCRAQKGQEE
jgi:hypothetical protein